MIWQYKSTICRQINSYISDDHIELQWCNHVIQGGATSSDIYKCANNVQYV